MKEDELAPGTDPLVEASVRLFRTGVLLVAGLLSVGLAAGLVGGRHRELGAAFIRVALWAVLLLPVVRVVLGGWAYARRRESGLALAAAATLLAVALSMVAGMAAAAR